MASLQGHVLLIGSVPCKLTTLTVDVRFNHWNRNRTNYRIKETPWLRKTKPFWKATRDWVIKIEWIWLETFQIKSLTAINTCARKFMHIALKDLWSFVSPEKKINSASFAPNFTQTRAITILVRRQTNSDPVTMTTRSGRSISLHIEKF